ncbi:hypothetical protein BAU15_01630 [Enterococcus sp. JM4C]|uniref:hypothetical protein n=1 Tax=Candidatus Enterococcus huntleyi TaxID=1857217 RepID=UPI00137B427E|nr:hypothetical protein [Enterococcus sp. JM4C]KAF1299373.1 hypothetical protein BAU15_01630 [Enterococcus sp. JM4C]
MNIFLCAGGRGLELNDVIKNKIPKVKLEPFANGLKLNESAYSLWGLSEFGALKPEALKEDDIVFISNNKCLVYIAKVFFCFEDDNIDDIAWFGQKQWKYKIVLKDPIKIFIPDENQNIDDQIKAHGKSKDELGEIKLWHKKGLGLRHVLSKKDRGNLQGNYKIGSNDKNDSYPDSDQIMSQFNWYCNITKYQCIEMYV